MVFQVVQFSKISHTSPHFGQALIPIFLGWVETETSKRVLIRNWENPAGLYVKQIVRKQLINYIIAYEMLFKGVVRMCQHMVSVCEFIT